jgi:hypothetical protein
MERHESSNVSGKIGKTREKLRAFYWQDGLGGETASFERMQGMEKGVHCGVQRETFILKRFHDFFFMKLLEEQCYEMF